VTPEHVAADRAAQVRRAAAGWRMTGLINEASERAVRDLFPDDRVRVGMAFRVLLAIFAGVAGLAALILAILVTDGPAVAWVVAPILVALTEGLVGSGKRAQGGIEEGLSFAAWVAVIVACVWLGDKGFGCREEALLRLALLGAAGAAGLAAWRWGMPLYAVAGAVSGFILLGTFDGGRWLILGTALAFTPLLSHGRSHPRVAPALRECLTAVMMACLAAIYLCVNYYSLDHRWIERAHHYQAAEGELGLVVGLAGVLGTALLPLAVLRRGIVTRDRLLLWFGLAGIAVGAVTLRAYVHLAPLWLLLILSGLAVFGLATLVGRYLEGGQDGERGGLTARPLGTATDLGKALEVAGTIASLTPAAPPTSPSTGFKGEGGQFGGGGASESF